MNTPIISIIVPVYKSEKYLSSCLESIINQSFSDFELICINDGSPDGCANILSSYSEKDSRIKIITQENKGQSSARNRGLDESIGKYIFFVDSDDCIHPQTLEIFYHVAKSSKAGITVSNTFIKRSKNKKFEIYSDVSDIKYEIHNHPVKDMLLDKYLSSIVWNKLYRRDFLDKHRFIVGIVFEDWPLISCLFSEVPFYSSFDYSLYLYNDRNESTTRSEFTSKKIQDYMTGIRFVHQYYQQPDKKHLWDLVRKIRISQSLKMVLSKVSKKRSNKMALAQCFLKEYDKLLEENIFFTKEFVFKSKIRLFLLRYSSRRLGNKRGVEQ